MWTWTFEIVRVISPSHVKDAKPTPIVFPMIRKERIISVYDECDKMYNYLGSCKDMKSLQDVIRIVKNEEEIH